MNPKDSASTWRENIRSLAFADLRCARFVVAVSAMFVALTLIVFGHIQQFGGTVFLFLFTATSITQFFILINGCVSNNFRIIFSAIEQAIWWSFVVAITTFSHLNFVAAEVAIATTASWIWIREGSIRFLR